MEPGCSVEAPATGICWEHMLEHMERDGDDWMTKLHVKMKEVGLATESPAPRRDGKMTKTQIKAEEKRAKNKGRYLEMEVRGEPVSFD